MYIQSHNRLHLIQKMFGKKKTYKKQQIKQLNEFCNLYLMHKINKTLAANSSYNTLKQCIATRLYINYLSPIFHNPYIKKIIKNIAFLDFFVKLQHK